jgi:hypothetical protein
MVGCSTIFDELAATGVPRQLLMNKWHPALDEIIRRNMENPITIPGATEVNATDTVDESDISRSILPAVLSQ